MFYLKNGRVVDSRGEVVGKIIEGKFTQNSAEVSRLYSGGLLPSELEQISETMQRSFVRGSK